MKTNWIHNEIETSNSYRCCLAVYWGYAATFFIALVLLAFA